MGIRFKVNPLLRVMEPPPPGKFMVPLGLMVVPGGTVMVVPLSGVVMVPPLPVGKLMVPLFWITVPGGAVISVPPVVVIEPPLGRVAEPSSFCTGSCPAGVSTVKFPDKSVVFLSSLEEGVSGAVSAGVVDVVADGVAPPPPPLLMEVKLAVMVVALPGMVNVVLALFSLANVPPLEEIHSSNL